MGAKHSILIVEGSRTQAERLRLVLQAHDYPVTVATGGEEALSLARAQRPALVISGVALSGMDGYDLCALVKQDAVLKQTPVVLLTALSDVDDLMRGLKAQVDYCIAKPYQEEDLIDRITAIMEEQVRLVDGGAHDGLEVLVRGERKPITAGRQQLMRLLLSTYENYSAVLRLNRSLSTAQLQLKTQNQHLQEECERLQTNLKKSSTVTSETSASGHIEEQEDRGGTPRVLVAEDTFVCRTLLARFLEKLGYQADLVENGAEAVLACQQRRYAAILMDVQMPVLGGVEATARIRQREQTSETRVPIIAVTAHTQAGDRERYLAAGMDEYLLKPVSLEALKRALSQWTSATPTETNPSHPVSASARVERVR